MKIFVVNLPESADRRSSVQQQMDSAGLAFEFFEAINGEQAMADWFSSYDEKEFLISTGRRASEGEKGCYASHLALWKRCVELNEPVIVMEDDFSLDRRFSAAVEVVSELIAEYGFIRLQTAPLRAETKELEHGNFSLYRYRRMPHCTMCYAISPKVAERFIAQSAVCAEPVDVYMKQFWKHKQPMYGLMPYVVMESPLGADSVVQNRKREKKAIGVKIARLFRKVYWGLARQYANLKFVVCGRY